MFAIIGIGPNSLEIPLVILASMEEAEKFVDQFPKDPKYPKNLSSDFAEEIGEYEQDEEGNSHPLYKKLFKDGDYYAGCGGCYSLEIRPVVFGEPMVGWNLD